jgi:putative glycosyltransferase (TIGR04372 family)
MGTPVRIFCFAGNRALGDFISQNVWAASVKNSLNSAFLTVYYQNDRPYKPEVVAMNRFADSVICPNAPLLLDWFDLAYLPPYRFPSDSWYELQVPQVDLFLLPSMMPWMGLAALPNPACLAFPEDRRPECERILLERGLDPGRWFAAVHTKEKGYKFRANMGGGRNINPETYWHAARYIIETLGGQVVRLGDPTMWKFPPLPGLVDLSDLEDSFLVHAFAVSRSRFVLAADSGIHPLGPALGVPTGATNLLSEAFPWNPHDVILTKTMVSPDGRHYRQQEALDAGYLIEGIEQKGFRLIDNTPAELCGVTKLLYERTSCCDGWRTTWGTGVNGTRRADLPFPVPRSIRASWYCM